nr:MAG TPA: chromosome segregation protein [Caudoviricetes sp.]
MMKLFEINNKQDKKTGYKRFKLILAEIYDKSCIVDETGTKYNDNGITWIDEYVENAKDTLIGSSVTVEFADDSKTDILGHGETGQYKDGVPLLSNATTIGHFDKSYIDKVTDNNGETKKVFVGEGTLDYMRYSDCIDLLSEKLSNNETIYGSVEIVRTENNPALVYLYGYKDIGRIPTEFEFSGYALLGCGVQPSDHTASLLELNNKNNKNEEEIITMDEKTLGMITDSIKATISECNSKNEEFESKITELNSALEIKTNENNDLSDKIEKLQKAIQEMETEREGFYAERDALEQELGTLKAEKRLAEMNTALANFTDEQKEYAKAEIEAFNADPIKSEINSITSKIYEGIGKATIASETEKAKVIAEQNSKKIDIFADVDDTSTNNNDDGSIY